MGFKDKADVVQGIAGIYILTLLMFSIFDYFGIHRQIPYEMQSGFFILIWDFIPMFLGIITVGLKEDNGIDLFGVILTILGLSSFIGRFLPEISGTFQFFAGIGMIITAIGLLLEAFDVIKPIKVK
jgi:hypothetical protein